MQHTSRFPFALGPRSSRSGTRLQPSAIPRSKEGIPTHWLCVPGRSTHQAVAWLGENGVMGLWPLLAAVLVVGLAVLFALLLAHQRRRIRYLLRNRLTPLSVLNEEPTSVQRGLPWAIVGVVVVIALAVLAFA